MALILLAEDDEGIRVPLVRALGREGHDVDAFEHGGEALAAAIDGRHDLLVLDVAARKAWQGDRELDLAPKEFDLLALLVREAGRVVKRERIMAEVWDENWFGSTKTLDMHVSWLRRKLGDDADDPKRLVTVRGVGLRFEP